LKVSWKLELEWGTLVCVVTEMVLDSGDQRKGRWEVRYGGLMSIWVGEETQVVFPSESTMTSENGSVLSDGRSERSESGRGVHWEEDFHIRRCTSH
jgi:hypothetical protein